MILARILLKSIGYDERAFHWSHATEQGSLPTHNVAVPTPSGKTGLESQPVNLLYLLHCNSTGEYGVELHQDLIHDSLSDQELFRFLRTVYSRARKQTKWLTLRNTTNISLCKVRLPPLERAPINISTVFRRPQSSCFCANARPRMCSTAISGLCLSPASKPYRTRISMPSYATRSDAVATVSEELSHALFPQSRSSFI